MTEGSAQSGPKDRDINENPTPSVPGFSCYAFADHPPSTRLGGQQNKNSRTESVGLEEVENKNINNIQRTRNCRTSSRNRNTRWEASNVQILVRETTAKEMSGRLEEVARAIYEQVCQLVKFETPLESTEAVSPPLRRTGTDG